MNTITNSASVPSLKQHSSKVGALTETLIVYGVAIGLMWLLEQFPGVESWQKEWLSVPVAPTLLAFLLLPLAVLSLKVKRRQTDTAAHSLTFASLTQALKVGGRSLNVMMPLTFLSFPFMMWLGYSFYGWTGSAIISGWHLLALPVLIWLLRGFDVQPSDRFTDRDLSVIGLVILGSLALIYLLQLFTELGAKLIFAWIYIGFAEEFFFRGYLQGVLNRAFGKPYQVMGIAIGPGLILASLLFGLAHVLTPSEPFLWPWAIWTFMAGLCFGIIREKGGGFLASAMVHAIIMSFYVIFGGA